MQKSKMYKRYLIGTTLGCCTLAASYAISYLPAPAYFSSIHAPHSESLGVGVIGKNGLGGRLRSQM
jgi:hypothetical protein